jgi:uncharacterized peroxidase-related enzyme
VARVQLLESAEERDPVVAFVWNHSQEIAGRLLNSFRLMTHVPHVCMWFLPFNLSLQIEGAGGRLDARTKQLVVLATSLANRCKYCISHNLSLGRASGVEEATIAAMTMPDLVSTLPRRDQVVLTWSRLVTTNEARHNSHAFEELREFFDDSEIVELTWLSAMFNMINRLHDSLHLDLDSETHTRGLVASRQVTRQTLIDYTKGLVELLEAGDHQ